MQIDSQKKEPQIKGDIIKIKIIRLPEISYLRMGMETKKGGGGESLYYVKE